MCFFVFFFLLICCSFFQQIALQSDQFRTGTVPETLDSFFPVISLFLFSLFYLDDSSDFADFTSFSSGPTQAAPAPAAVAAPAATGSNDFADFTSFQSGGVAAPVAAAPVAAAPAPAAAPVMTAAQLMTSQPLLQPQVISSDSFFFCLVCFRGDCLVVFVLGHNYLYIPLFATTGFSEIHGKQQCFLDNMNQDLQLLCCELVNCCCTEACNIGSLLYCLFFFCFCFCKKSRGRKNGGSRTRR